MPNANYYNNAPAPDFSALMPPCPVVQGLSRGTRNWLGTVEQRVYVIVKPARRFPWWFYLGTITQLPENGLPAHERGAHAAL